MPEDIKEKLDSMKPEDQAKFMSELKDGGEGYSEDPEPALETETEGAEPEGKEPVEKEKEWAGEAEEPPAEGQEPPEGDELEEFLSLDIESVPEEHRGKFQKARDKVIAAIERAKEKERGADKKFREAADMRKQIQPEPKAPVKPKEPWFVRHGLKLEDAEVFRDFYREEVIPTIYPFFQDQLKAKEELTKKDMRAIYNEDHGFPDFIAYEDKIDSLIKELPGLTYEEAYFIAAGKDGFKRATEIGTKTKKENLLRKDQAKREKEHYFEDSTPRQERAGKIPEPKTLTPRSIKQHMDALKAKDPSGKLLTEFMGSLEEDTRR